MKSMISFEELFDNHLRDSIIQDKKTKTYI